VQPPQQQQQLRVVGQAAHGRSGPLRLMLLLRWLLLLLLLLQRRCLLVLVAWTSLMTNSLLTCWY
jgi:hypothetical protein